MYLLNILVVQTGSLFPAAAKNGEEVVRDSIHPSDRGQELLSQVILSVLQQ